MKTSSPFPPATVVKVSLREWKITFTILCLGEGEGYHPMMYMDDDALLQMAIERSLQGESDPGGKPDENFPADQVTLYEALGHPGAQGNRPEVNNRYVDYDLQRYGD